MGTFTNGVYVPALGETGWGTNVNDFLTRSGEEYVNVRQAPYAATGDGSTDDTTAIQAAIAAAGTGGRVYFPEGVFVVSSALSPLTSQTWVGAGQCRYDGTAGTTIRYSGTADALTLSGVNNFRCQDLTVKCTNNAGGGINITNSNFFTFENMTVTGPGTGGDVGLLMSGTGNCQCHGLFVGMTFNGWSTGVWLSGDSNANVFEACLVQTCATGLRIAKTGADTYGGQTNLFLRFEVTTTTGLVMADTSVRNVFAGLVMDGVTTAGSISSSCTDTLFVGGYLGASWTDSGNRTTYLATTVNSQQHTSFGSYVAGSVSAASSGIGVAGQSEFNQRISIGGYSGSLSSSTGLGVFGNAEFSNALAIGGALDHNGTSVGFYGTTPVAKQTGVAVTTAAVHAALVNLGLIGP